MNLTNHDDFNTITDQVCSAWPDHRRFIDNAWAANAPFLNTANQLAAIVLKIAGNSLNKLIDGYRWMCKMMMEEELYFRRHGKYRLSSFSESERLVYQKPDLMELYMDGLLLSQALWPNHVRSFDFYLYQFLANIDRYGKHLEVGPGHGLLLHFAMQVLATPPEAWDISPTAIRSTQECLKALQDDLPVNLDCRDIMTIDNNDHNRYHSIVISEVLEHSEKPECMLRNVKALLAHDGNIFINIPVNSPSIDHISLFRNPEEVASMIERVGLEIEQTLIAPAAGLDELTARKRETTISCIFIAKPANSLA